MACRILKYFIINLILINAGNFFPVVIPAYSQANSSGEITFVNMNTAFGSRDTIDLGMCLIGDSIETTFIITNNSNRTLYYRNESSPFTYGIESSIKSYPRINDRDEFQNGNSPNDIGNFVLLAGSQRTQRIVFKPSVGNPNQPIGKKEVILTLGVYDPQLVPDGRPKDTSQVFAYKKIFIRARKTDKNIDGFDNELNFGYVYVQPKDTVSMPCTFKNNTRNTLQVISDSIRRYYRTDLKFDKQITSATPISIDKQKTHDWTLKYYPTALGEDSANFKIEYHPYPDSSNVDSVLVTVRGTGVIQDLRIIDALSNSSRDTLYWDSNLGADVIDVGDVKVMDSVEINVILLNNGNYPVGKLTENVYVEKSSLIDTNFRISKPFLKDTEKIDIEDQTQCIMTCRPDHAGNFLSRYVFETDISKRVYGSPLKVQKKIFYIKGRGIEPSINLESTIADFGDVFIKEDCPDEIKLPIRISNFGSMELEISDIYLEPRGPNPFSIDTHNLRIPVDGTKTLTVTFSTKDLEKYKRYDWTLVIVSNATHPKDTIKIQLLARGVDPSSLSISLPDEITAKPGNQTIIPILVDKEKIILAKTFTDTLTYDRSLLQYSKYLIMNTASDGAARVNINEDTAGGRLYIEIEMQNKFEPNENLINLIFNTFISTNSETSILSTEPLLGDGHCPKIFSIPNKIKSIFRLDSLCGLDFLISILNHGTIKLGGIAPNPASDNISISYEISRNGNVSIVIYNSYGQIVANPVNSYKDKGIYLADYNISALSPGIYLCELNGLGFKEVKTFVITK